MSGGPLAWSVDGAHGAQLPVDDRGLAYGDGLFETLRVQQGVALWWDAHWARLQRGAVRLGLDLPPPDRLRGEAAELLAGTGDAVLKIVLTRGSGGRGYRPNGMNSRRILSLFPLPEVDDTIEAIRCSTRLGVQPALAGLKHLNRLENVLAARECGQAGADEGLLFDDRDRLVSAVSGNVVLRIDGQWLTPTLQNCGIAGICRDWLLGIRSDSGRPAIKPSEIGMDDVERAEAGLVCNSVRGILPLSRLDGRALQMANDVLRWRDQLQGTWSSEPDAPGPDPYSE